MRSRSIAAPVNLGTMALAAAERLDAEVALVVAASGRPESDRPF